MKVNMLVILSTLVAMAVICSGCTQPTASPTASPAPTGVPPAASPSPPAATASPTPAPSATPPPPVLTATSTAFKAGETLPAKYTADGSDLSPPLAWSGAPGGTGSFAVICDDTDATGGTFTHWVVFNIPAGATGLPEGVPRDIALSNGAPQGTNGFGKIGYNGPAPPPGGQHHYRFEVYALDGKLSGISPGATSSLLRAYMQGHILAQDTLTGLYGH